MKTRRFVKSRKSKRRSSKKRGGMFRRVTSDAAKKAAKVLTEIVGKDPVNKADKLKQAADKVGEAIMKSRQDKSNQSPHITASTFSSPVSFNSPIEIHAIHNLYHDPNVFRTPSKTLDANVEPMLARTTRHQSVVANRTHTYAPTLHNAVQVNKRLFE